MAVKVEFLNEEVETFDAEGDEFSERQDGKLEIHRADGTTKIFKENTWLSVDGKKRSPVFFA
ncbi:MAG: hypothetical protein CK429_24705 [Mycobacterium sp.]|nr:MAG: hypothetical protein CK429_24705 [Mycobacterium sp.]